VNEASIQFRKVSLDFKLANQGAITSFKEWAIRRLTRKLSYRKMRALDHLTFDVPIGATLGVVGDNGAGKSTLLRIAAGILQPSEGIATMRGEISPIIELGTGFEFELSGRENIFFNGALLGRSWSDMNDRVDEIVNFSELGEFIDQPIRTYSTGMIVRLAFAIATTVDPSILLLDEILSVGDQRFQTKCNQRMLGFQERGVTTVLVSHSLSAIEKICSSCLWLDHGQLKAYGPVDQVIAEYLVCVEAQNKGPIPGGAPARATG